MKKKLPTVGGKSGAASATAATQGRERSNASNRKRKVEEAALRTKKKHDKNVLLDQTEDVQPEDVGHDERTDDETASYVPEADAESSSSDSDETASDGTEADAEARASDDGEEEDVAALRPRRRQGPQVVRGEARAAGGKKPITLWQIESDPGGGPKVCDLLYGFGHWGNPTCQSVVKFHTRQQHLDWFSRANLAEDDRAWLTAVDASGIQHLHDTTIRRTSSALLTAFVERWSPVTNTFHMPWGEMTITMHDVTHILGISCLGIHVRKADPELDLDEIQRHLIGCLRGTSYTLHDLRLAFEARSAMTDDQRASTYILFILGCTLFVDKSQDKMPAAYLSLCMDLPRVGRLAWGSAALAYLYRELGKASRSGCAQMGGCSTLLEGWIYEYFPDFRRLLNPQWQEGQPRALKWSRSDRAGREMEHLLMYRRTLDTMPVERVCWTPYGTGVNALLPVSYFRGIIRFLDITEAYMSDRVTRQFAIQQRIPRMTPLQPIPCTLMAGQKGYKKAYGDRDDIWVEWMDYNMDSYDPLRRLGPLVTTSSPVTPDYMDWFRARSHVRISNLIHEPAVDIPPQPGLAEALPGIRDMLLPLLTDDRIPEDIIATITRVHEMLGYHL